MVEAVAVAGVSVLANVVSSLRDGAFLDEGQALEAVDTVLAACSANAASPAILAPVCVFVSLVAHGRHSATLVSRGVVGTLAAALRERLASSSCAPSSPVELLHALTQTLPLPLAASSALEAPGAVLAIVTALRGHSDSTDVVLEGTAKELRKLVGPASCACWNAAVV